jgi:hypothetical protein
VRLAIPAVVALYAWFDDAGAVGLGELVTILARMADEGKRSDASGCGALRPASEVERDGLANQRTKSVFVHMASL